MSIIPTSEQEAIIAEESNCVVVAKPGSGKTATIVWKIGVVLSRLPHYKGVIAISFTNKASDELKRRCFVSGNFTRESFFGTVDSFFLSEIIIPFGRHIFGYCNCDFVVSKLEEVNCIENPNRLATLISEGSYLDLEREYTESLGRLYTKGCIILESFGFLALFVFRSSLACRRYLKARYPYVFIDEYQDCGYWQHELFVELVNLGIIGVAVGDLDQSIFAFAQKDPRYLASLVRDSVCFTTYSLSINHRCHTSIVNYSLRLMSPNSRLLSTDEMRMFVKRVKGSETDIGVWLSSVIPTVKDYFEVSDMGKIAILARSRRTANLIHQNLSTPHKPIIDTPLDSETSLWGNLFRKILHVVLGNQGTKYELIEDYLNIDLSATKTKPVMKQLTQIQHAFESQDFNPEDLIEMFVSIATHMIPNGFNKRALSHLECVILSTMYLSSYMLPNNEVQLMTLHKAKGLEFEIVFHVDLYKYVLPQYKCSEEDWAQYLNLHYVGITRAEKATILCTSSHRHNAKGQCLSAEDSEFLCMNELQNMRMEFPF